MNLYGPIYIYVFFCQARPMRRWCCQCCRLIPTPMLLRPENKTRGRIRVDILHAIRLYSRCAWKLVSSQRGQKAACFQTKFLKSNAKWWTTIEQHKAFCEILYILCNLSNIYWIILFVRLNVNRWIATCFFVRCCFSLQPKLGIQLTKCALPVCSNSICSLCVVVPI